MVDDDGDARCPTPREVLGGDRPPRHGARHRPPVAATRSSPWSTPPSTRGSREIVVTHPEFPSQDLSIEDQTRARASAARCSSAASRRRTRARSLGAVDRRTSARSAPSTPSVERPRPDVQSPVEDGLALMADRLLAGRVQRRGGLRDGGDEHARLARSRGPVSAAGMQVIGAHSADFVWRAGGAIAVTTAAGGDGRGHRAVLRRARRVGRAVEGRRARRSRTSSAIRHAEAEGRRGARARASAASTSATTACRSTARRCWRSRTRSASSRPTCSITHTDTDPFNPDHPVAYAAVDRARGLAAGAGVPSAFATITPPALFLFEPHQPELCNFTPTTFVDITAVMDAKRAGDGRDEGADATCRPTTSSAPSSAATMRGARSGNAGGPATPRRSSG